MEFKWTQLITLVMWIVSFFKGKPEALADNGSTVQLVRMKNVKAGSITLKNNKGEAGRRTRPGRTDQETTIASYTATRGSNINKYDMENVECGGPVNIEPTL